MRLKLNTIIAFFCIACILMSFTARAAETGASTGFTTAAESMSVITVRASTPGFNWMMPSPAPVLDVFVDGSFLCNLVLFAGENPFDYRLLAGPVATGAHKIEIKPSSARPTKIAFFIEKISVESFAKETPEYQAYVRAPFLYGREENDISDTPLLQWVEVTKAANGNTDYKYSFVWTNEDGGTRTASLMARYGRAVDIEYAIMFTVTPEGKNISAPFQTFDHEVKQFEGKYQGMRPIMRDATQNNVFDDEGTSSLLFSPAPVIAKEPPYVRELMLDANPWTYRIMAEEMQKEGKIIPEIKANDTDVTKLADPRHYVYVDFNISAMLPGFKAQIDVKLKGSDKWHSSARGIAELGMDLIGWHRSAVYVGRIVTTQDVEAVRIKFLNTIANNMGNSIKVHNIERIMTLDENYMPHEQKITIPKPGNITSSKPQFVVQVQQ